MLDEIDVVVAETFGRDDASIDVQRFEQGAEAFTDPHFLVIDLRRADEDDADEVELRVGREAFDERLTDVVTRHFLRGRADARQRMNRTVAHLVRRQHDRHVAAVDVLLAALDAAGLDRADDVVVHRALSHDFLDEHDARIAFAAQVFTMLLAHDFALVFLELVAHSLDDVVLAFVRGKRAGARHAGLLRDDGMATDDDVALVGAARMAEVHLLIEESFGRAELMHLHAIFVNARQQEHDTVRDFRDAFAEHAFDFRRNRADVHDRVGVDVALARMDDVELEALAERVFLDGLVRKAAVNGDDAVLNLRLRADDGIRNLDVLLDQRADDFLRPGRLCGRSGGRCSRCGNRSSCASAEAAERDVDGKAGNFFGRVNLDMHGASCHRRGNRGSRRLGGGSWCRCGGRHSRRAGFRADMVEHVRRDRRQSLDILRQRRAEDFGDREAVGAELQ